MRTSLAALLDLDFPLIQAPMAGVSTAALAGAVSGTGALGSIAVGAMTPDAADSAIAAAMQTTGGVLNVNVFTHPPARPDPEREAAWLARLTPYFTEVGAEPPAALREIYRTFDDEPRMLDVLLAQRPPVVSLHFGLPRPAALSALRQAGITLLATATSAREARMLDEAGIDVIVAQGWEAGGHRGVFGSRPDERLPTFALVERMTATVARPVVAAGGISDGSAVARALQAGAAGVQLGTVFIDCPESAAGEAYRRALRASDRTTTMTAVFSGRPARGLVNRLSRELADEAAAVPDYPRAYDAGKALAAAAEAAGSHAFTAMWAGQGPPRREALPAVRLVGELRLETEAAASPVD